MINNISHNGRPSSLTKEEDMLEYPNHTMQK